MSNENEDIFDNLETHFRCILAWIDSDFGRAYEEENRFEKLINKTKKKGKVSKEDVSLLRDLTQEIQEKFILDWCQNLSDGINERKGKTQDFSDIENDLDNLGKYVKEHRLDKKEFRKRYEEIKQIVKKIKSRLIVENTNNKLFWKGIWMGAIIGFILGLVGTVILFIFGLS